MAVFATLVQLGLKSVFRYPWGLLISLLIDPVVLVLNIMVFTALYRQNDSQSIAGYGLSQMIWYFAGSTFIWFWTVNFTDSRISRRVQRGDLAQDLLRPVSIFIWELAFAVALRVSGVLLEFIPSLILYSLIFPPDFLTPAALLRFVIAAGTAFLIYFAFNFLLGLASFYITSTRALQGIKFMVVGFLAGAFIPLEFFPVAIQNLLHALPFAYIFYWPIHFFLNRDAASGWETFMLREGIALLWLTVLLLLANIFWRQAVRRYTDAGG